MMANEKRKVMQLMSARSSFKLTESKIGVPNSNSNNATTKRNQPDFKAEADKRENQLLKEAADDLTSLGDESAIVSTANKQPPPLRLSITHRAPATNIFNQTATQGGDNSRRSYNNQNQRSSRVTYTGRKEEEEDIDMRGTIQFNATNEFTKSRGIIEEAPEDSSQNEDQESEVISFRKKLGGQPPSHLQNQGSQSIISHTRSQMSSARRPNDRY